MLDHPTEQGRSATYHHSSDGPPAEAAPRSCQDDQLLHRALEQQAARTPHAIAVVADGQHLTFGELNQRANQLAHFLHAHGVSPDALVGICVERSLEMVVGLLGILKAGGAYLPLDPSYPRDRLSYMLEDAAPKIVLTQARLQSTLPASRATVIAMDSGWSEISNHGSDDFAPQALGLRPDHLAYVIYTSGSTGRPKGAMNEHRAVVNRIAWMQEQYRLGPHDRVLQKTPFSFDVSVWEFFWTLMGGARLIMARPDGHRDPAYLQDLIEETGVTTLHFVPSMLQVFLQQQGSGRCPSLRHIVCSGEELSPSLQNRCLTLLPQARLSNLYGPTECAVDVTAWECVADAECRRVPIGRPIANTQVYILDDCLQPVAAGETGRIFIGGVAVGRGYWKRPELTAERFMKDPFSSDREARMYDTGDLGRWRSDGAVEYLGRTDFQVKIRGLRIELGEIEARLATFPGIAANVVVVREDEPGEKLLVAYLTSAAPREAIAADELRTHLRTALPEYMVPTTFVHLDAFPLNPSGKLDRAALPKPSAEAFARQTYEAPVGGAEETVAAIWAKVLRIERVSRDDNFFELGGHSLLLASVVGELARQGLRIDIRAAFTARTLQEFSSAIHAGFPVDTRAAAPLIPDGCTKITPEMLPLVSLQQAEIESILREVPGGARNVQDIYPLTPLQEGILFHHLLSPEHDPYVFAKLLEFATEADFLRYLQAWESLIDRHDALRTSFAWEGLERPVQIVHRRATLDVARLPARDTFDEAVELLTDRMSGKGAAFNPRVAPLIRLVAVADSRTGRMLALQEMHRLAVDAVSNGVLDFELLFYQQNRHAALPAPVPYRHFIREITGRTLEGAIELFRSRLGDVDESTAPFQLFQDPVASGGNLQDLIEARRSVSPELLARVRRAARLAGVSTGTMMHLAWALVAARSTDRTDVVFGTVLSGRMLGELDAQRAVGLFINSLPIRVKLAGQSVREALAQVHAALAELIDFEHAPLAVAQRLSGVQGSRPLFTSILNYRQPRAAAAIAGDGGIPGWFALVKQQDPAHYPFSMSVDEFADAMTLIAQVDPRADAHRVVAYWHTALESMTTALEGASSAAVLDLEILPPDERQRLLANFREDYPAKFEPVCVHQLVEARVAKAPGAIALIHEDRALTYGELNAAADRVAADLRMRGVGPNTLVGLYVERSPELVMGMLGILKAGGAYLPLDPAYPEERLIQVLSDAAPPLVLSTSDLEGGLPATGAQVVLLDEPDSWLSELAPAMGSNAAPALQDLAYVIFTSGSTGKPKGVCIAHRQIANLVQAIGERYPLSSNDRVLQFVSPSFDVSAQEILGTLAAGATLVLRTEAWVADPETFWKLCAATGISILHLPTAFWRRLVDSSHAAPPCVRIIAVGGERMDGGAVSRWLAAQGSTLRTLNEYGPTEATVTATVHECAQEDVSGVPVGTPLEHVYLRVLDAGRRLSPIGAIGELYIGGAGVAAGYLNRPELTAERFVSDPCEADARLYRTGDFVRWLPTGELEFIGRKDNQVKVRGFRIELGEIEAQLTACRQVREAVVLAREDADGDKRLVAYVTAATEERPQPSEVLGFLEARLPKYMVPGALVVLGALPLTSNGKVDVKELPAPDAASGGTRAFEPPATDLEQTLAEAWQEILRIPQVGRNDNFFDLGGHSLQIVQLVDRLHRAGLRADVQTAFHAKSLAELAQSLEPAADRPFEAPRNLIPGNCERITPELLDLVILTQEQIDRIAQAVPGGSWNVKDIYPLTPLQEGMLFHSRLHTDGDPYVSPQLFEFPSRENLNAFLAAWRFLIDRHDVLRTAFVWDGLPRPVQVVQRRAQLPIEYLELDPALDPLEQLKAQMRPGGHWLDLETAPLIRVRIARDPTSPRMFAMLEMHHLLGDNISHQLIDAELAAFREGRSGELPVAVPYRNLVANSLKEDRRAAAEQFFTAKLKDVTEPTAPFELVEVYSSGQRQDEAEEAITGELVGEIRRAARAMRVSVATLMHAAWALVLARCATRDDIVFGTVFSGRLQGIADADRAVGLWISTLPIRLKLASVSAEQLVENTHRELLELTKYEQTPLELAQKCTGLDSAAPLITTNINYRRVTLVDMGEHGRKVLNDWFTVHHFIERTNFPIAASVNDYGDRITLIMFADERIGARPVLSYMRTAVEALVRALNTAPETRALSLAVVPQSELKLTLQDFNETAVDFADGSVVHELFEYQVECTPDAMALFCAGRTLTYGELNRRANQLAHHLRARGVGPDVPVGLCTERTLEMVVGLLGILKAGGAYVPLDPAYPVERLAYMAEDCAAPVFVTGAAQARRLTEIGAGCAVIDLQDPTCPIWSEADCNLDARAIGLTQRSLAYVIYTSGSTGRPKGVMVEHRSVVNFAHVMRTEIYGAHPDVQRVAWNASFTFDMSAKAWLQLLAGRTVYVIRDEVRLDARAMLNYLQIHRIEAFECTPSQLNALVEVGLLTADLAIKEMFVGGEHINPALWTALAEHRSVVFHNMYGPTETTVAVMDARLSGTVPHIGRPLANSQIYILDTEGKPVPIGVPGEIHIAGAGLARGYLGQPALTRERFIANPFGEEKSALMYRTGDLGRWRPDGTIEYLGRNDFQVKIRGFRVELGEIEARLKLYPGVREAAVVARDDGFGGKRLTAYYTATGNARASLTPHELRAHIVSALPDYMAPGAYVKLNALPLTNSGKIDRQALPDPADDSIVSQDYEAPLSGVETVVARVWADMLKLKRVGRRDNFFELGGNSLLVVRMIEQLRRAGVDLGLRDPFVHPVLADLASVAAAGAAAERHTHLVEIKSDGIKAPLFLIHEISGEVLPYLQLAQLLDDVPVYGLQAGPMTHVGSEVSAESLADTYLEEIRSVQAQGPYRIAGWSFGGTLAYEIARQLLSAGEEVSFLGLIDCAVGERHGNPADESDVSLFARYYLQVLGVELTWQIAEELRSTTTLQQALQLCQDRGYLSSALTLQLVAARLLQLRKFIAAGSSYRPSPLPLVVSYFAADRPDGRHDTGGWEEALGNRLVSSTAGGNHFTILKQPHVARLATLINEAVERSEKVPGQLGEKRAVA